ncbi:MAG: 50S ribosomal protein L32e [Desulfurococcaceae archaeon]
MSAELKRDLKHYLELRRKTKERQPEFLRYLWWKKPKFSNDLKWRKPKGVDNKARLQLKGYPPVVKVGYRGPAVVRDLHPRGLMPVVVHSPNELSKYSPAESIIYIGRRVGLKKKIEIYKIAVEKGFKVANPPKLTELAKGVSK